MHPATAITRAEAKKKKLLVFISSRTAYAGVCTFSFLPQVSEHCCLSFGWRAGHAWNLPPSSPRCLEIDSCCHSVAHYIWAACRKRSLSLQRASALLSCADASCRWPEQNLSQGRDGKKGQSVPRLKDIIEILDTFTNLHSTVCFFVTVFIPDFRTS